MINLKFNAMKIAEIEDEKNDSVIVLLQSFKLSILALFIEKGANISRDESYKKIDEYLASGKSTEELYIDVLEAVQKNGFLPKMMDCDQMRKSLSETKEKFKKQLAK